jgi:hypothetical protein
MAAGPKKHLNTLKRRADFLAKRVKDNPDLSFDRNERAALKWAVDTLTQPCADCGRIIVEGTI